VHKFELIFLHFFIVRYGITNEKSVFHFVNKNDVTIVCTAVTHSLIFYKDLATEVDEMVVLFMTTDRYDIIVPH